MNKPLQNKIVFITGASSGIGKATALQCAQAGANLIICARRVEKLEALAQQIKHDYAVEVKTLALDVQDHQAIVKTLQALPTQWQKIDILINNAGLALGRDRLDIASIDDINTMIDTNIKGLLYVTKAILPGMIERNAGHIVNLGSIAGHETYAGGMIYCATKSAVLALTSGLRKDLLGKAIRVSVISPGMVHTEFSEVRFKGDVNKAEQVYEGLTPLSAEDIADNILYCITRPSHVNISEIIVLPTEQASATMVAKK